MLRAVVVSRRLVAGSRLSSFSYINKKRAFSNQTGNGEPSSTDTINNNSEDQDKRSKDREMLEQLRLAVAQKAEGEVFL